MKYFKNIDEVIDFMMDFDPYDFKDNYDTREDAVEDAIAILKDKKLQKHIKSISELIKKDTTTIEKILNSKDSTYYLINEIEGISQNCLQSSEKYKKCKEILLDINDKKLEKYDEIIFDKYHELHLYK